MPQMMPLIWMSMLLSLLFILFLIITSLHFFIHIPPYMFNLRPAPSPPQSYWNWKW